MPFSKPVEAFCCLQNTSPAPCKLTSHCLHPRSPAAYLGLSFTPASGAWPSRVPNTAFSFAVPFTHAPSACRNPLPHISYLPIELYQPLLGEVFSDLPCSSSAPTASCLYQFHNSDLFSLFALYFRYLQKPLCPMVSSKMQEFFAIALCVIFVM